MAKRPNRSAQRTGRRRSYSALPFVTESELPGEDGRPMLAVDWWSVPVSSDFADREPGRLLARDFLRLFQADSRRSIAAGDQPEIVLSWIVSAMLRKGQLGATERGFLEEVGQTLGRALAEMPAIGAGKAADRPMEEGACANG